MRILKIFFVLLIPAVSLVGCKKSNCKPAMDSGNQSTASKTIAPSNIVVANDPNAGGANARRIGGDVDNGDGNGTTILGSGDDDRDGGDKGKKKTVK